MVQVHKRVQPWCLCLLVKNRVSAFRQVQVMQQPQLLHAQDQQCGTGAASAYRRCSYTKLHVSLLPPYAYGKDGKLKA